MKINLKHSFIYNLSHIFTCVVDKFSYKIHMHFITLLEHVIF